jgi:hypothetical protein
MSKYNYDSYDENDENDQEEKIENLSKYIVNLYEANVKTNTLEGIRNEIIYYIDEYDIHRKISEYHEELYQIYSATIKEYMEYECPGEILNTGLNMAINISSLHEKFIQWAYENTEIGLELDYIERIYYSLL